MEKIYTVTKECTIAIAHQLHLPYESPCNNLHGHNLKVKVTCKSTELNSCNMVVDFKIIKNLVMQFDHKYLNEKLLETNPTSEVLAEFLLDNITNCVKVEVWESDGNCAICELQGK